MRCCPLFAPTVVKYNSGGRTPCCRSADGRSRDAREHPTQGPARGALGPRVPLGGMSTLIVRSMVPRLSGLVRSKPTPRCGTSPSRSPASARRSVFARHAHQDWPPAFLNRCCGAVVRRDGWYRGRRGRVGPSQERLPKTRSDRTPTASESGHDKFVAARYPRAVIAQSTYRPGLRGLRSLVTNAIRRPFGDQATRNSLFAHMTMSLRGGCSPSIQPAQMLTPVVFSVNDAIADPPVR